MASAPRRDDKHPRHFYNGVPSGKKGRYTGRDIKQPAACEACDLVQCGTIVDLVRAILHGDRLVRNALRIEMKDDREKTLSLTDFANQRAYVSD